MACCLGLNAHTKKHGRYVTLLQKCFPLDKNDSFPNTDHLMKLRVYTTLNPERLQDVVTTLEQKIYRQLGRKNMSRVECATRVLADLVECHPEVYLFVDPVVTIVNRLTKSVNRGVRQMAYHTFNTLLLRLIGNHANYSILSMVLNNKGRDILNSISVRCSEHALVLHSRLQGENMKGESPVPETENSVASLSQETSIRHIPSRVIKSETKNENFKSSAHETYGALVCFSNLCLVAKSQCVDLTRSVIPSMLHALNMDLSYAKRYQEMKHVSFHVLERDESMKGIPLRERSLDWNSVLSPDIEIPSPGPRNSVDPSSTSSSASGTFFCVSNVALLILTNIAAQSNATSVTKLLELIRQYFTANNHWGNEWLVECITRSLTYPEVSQIGFATAQVLLDLIEAEPKSAYALVIMKALRWVAMSVPLVGSRPQQIAQPAITVLRTTDEDEMESESVLVSLQLLSAIAVHASQRNNSGQCVRCIQALLMPFSVSPLFSLHGVHTILKHVTRLEDSVWSHLPTLLSYLDVLNAQCEIALENVCYILRKSIQNGRTESTKTTMNGEEKMIYPLTELTLTCLQEAVSQFLQLLISECNNGAHVSLKFMRCLWDILNVWFLSIFVAFDSNMTTVDTQSHVVWFLRFMNTLNESILSIRDAQLQLAVHGIVCGFVVDLGTVWHCSDLQSCGWDSVKKLNSIPAEAIKYPVSFHHPDPTEHATQEHTWGGRFKSCLLFHPIVSETVSSCPPVAFTRDGLVNISRVAHIILDRLNFKEKEAMIRRIRSSEENERDQQPRGSPCTFASTPYLSLPVLVPVKPFSFPQKKKVLEFVDAMSQHDDDSSESIITTDRPHHVRVASLVSLEQNHPNLSWKEMVEQLEFWLKKVQSNFHTNQSECSSHVYIRSFPEI